MKAYTSGREADYVTSVLDCATALQYRAVEVVLNVLVEGLDKRAALVAVKPFPEQCVSAEPKVTCVHTYVHVCDVESRSQTCTCLHVCGVFIADVAVFCSGPLLRNHDQLTTM